MSKIESIIEEWINQDKKFYSLFFILALVTFFPVIFSPHLIDIDYGHVFEPIDKLSSIGAYFTHEIHIIDIQPVRDLFMMFMLKVNSFFDHQLLGSFNFIMWALSVLILEKILKRFTSKSTARLVTLCVLLHPIASWTLYWPTAIKHLLALFFISLSGLYTLKFKESQGANWTGFKVFLFYLLAVNSQPIIIFYPIVLALFLHKDLKSKYPWPTIILCFLTMILFTGFNYFYYRDVYPLFVGSVKMDPLNVENMAINLFGLSRSLSQLLIPTQFAVNYTFTSFLNFVGLPLFVFFVAMMSKRFHWKFLFFHICLILFPLGTIYGNRTNIFVSDTYLLVPLFSLSIFLTIYIFNKYQLQKLLIFFIICLGIKSRYESQITTNEDLIFKMSYLREPECKNAFSYSSNLLFDLKIDEFKSIANTTMANNCLLIGGGARVLTTELYSFLVFFSEETSVERKIELITSTKNKTPIIHFILDKLKIEAGTLSVSSSNYKNIQERHIIPSRQKLFNKLKEEL